MATQKQLSNISDAFLDLLASEGWHRLSAEQIAQKSGVKLSLLREIAPTKMDYLALFLQRVDKAVLDNSDLSDSEGDARSRLAAQLMNRLDALEPARGAIKALRRAACQDPLLALKINRLAVRSQSWMLIAAGISLSHPIGPLVAQGLVVEFSRVIGIWLDENEADGPKTMAALDKALARGEMNLRRLMRTRRGLQKLACCVKSAMTRCKGSASNTADVNDKGPAPA